MGLEHSITGLSLKERERERAHPSSDYKAWVSLLSSPPFIHPSRKTCVFLIEIKNILIILVLLTRQQNSKDSMNLKK